MQLYLIIDSVWAENTDLFVEADSPQRAVQLWRELNEIDGDFKPERVFAVNPTGMEGVLGWHTAAVVEESI